MEKKIHLNIPKTFGQLLKKELTKNHDHRRTAIIDSSSTLVQKYNYKVYFIHEIMISIFYMALIPTSKCALH